VPRLAGTLPELRLLLLCELPGERRLARLLRAPSSSRALERDLASCATLAAALHEHAGIAPARTWVHELLALERELALLGALDDGRAAGWVARAGALAAASEPLPLRLAHGDLTHSQVVFDGERPGLLDLDDVCTAEPALDLGRFCAYLRLAARKAAGDAAEERGEACCRTFLDAYARSAGLGRPARERLLERVQVYELASLILAFLRSCRQLKPARAARAAAIVCERTRCLP
jgi:Ser/Thr protein kinase RdoA (MazF antagonist)